jgi:hypothetical protein
MDGVERIPDVSASPGVVPFRVTGQQFPKHRVLLQQLIPGNAYTFPNESLSSQELVSILTTMLTHAFCFDSIRYLSSLLLPNGHNYRGGELTIHFHLVPRSRIMEPYLQSPIRLQDVMLD